MLVPPSRVAGIPILPSTPPLPSPVLLLLRHPGMSFFLSVLNIDKSRQTRGSHGPQGYSCQVLDCFMCVLLRWRQTASLWSFRAVVSAESCPHFSAVCSCAQVEVLVAGGPPGGPLATNACMLNLPSIPERVLHISLHGATGKMGPVPLLAAVHGLLRGFFGG